MKSEGVEQLLESLDQVTDLVLNSDSAESSENPIFGLYDKLNAASFDDLVGDKSVGFETPNGWVVSPFRAALCLIDTPRTIAFIRGSHDAVLDQRRNDTRKRVNILYLGHGPFGSLILPLTRRFTPDEIGITAVDINPKSKENFGHIVRLLGIEDYIDDIIEKDASDLEDDAVPRPDIILSETMNCALVEEPYAHIAGHVAHMLGEDGVLLPKRVSVYLDALVFTEGCQMPRTVRLGNLIDLTKEYLLKHGGNERDFMINGTFPIPEYFGDHAVTFMLKTEVQVYGEHLIEHQASDITKAVPLKCKRGKLASGERSITVNYRPGCHVSEIKVSFG